jgi:hypothetical protein
VFYRVGKRINKDDGIDPCVWSTTYSFVVTAPPNQPPNANAGADRVITLPANSTTITGTGSDQEGPVTFSWAKRSGPTAGTIATPNAATTSVTGLAQGAYSFELTVRDNAGATAKDRVNVTVNAAPPANRPDLTVVSISPLFTSSGDSFVSGETGNFDLCSFEGTATQKITSMPNLIVRVRNVGLAATTRTCTLQVDPGSNSNIANQTFTVPVLQPGASEQFTIARIERRVCATRSPSNPADCVRCGAGIVPRWNDNGISATVDSTVAITETDETNNTFSAP